MEKVAVVGCGTYMDQGHGCPGEWRCLKAASEGDGKFDPNDYIFSANHLDLTHVLFQQVISHVLCSDQITVV